MSWIFLLCVVLSFIIMNHCKISAKISTLTSLNMYFIVKVVSGSFAGLAISQSSALAGTIQFGIQQLAQVVSQMISVERVLEFSKIEKEPSQSLVSSMCPLIIFLIYLLINVYY